MLTPGTILGDRYEIIDHIGSGGMADVYKAKCHVLNRYVAIKVLRDEFNEDEQAVEKFITEAQSTADLQNANIVNVYDARHNDYIHYIVMELAEGITLKKYIQRYGRLSTREVVDFSLQICNGIEAAHKQKIVHRDIKPQNILVSNSGKIKVADFGNAKVVSAHTKGISAFGSVHYFSPEQARGGIADERSDIYSLGITMYEMVTGKVPFDADNSVSIALKHLHEEMKAPRELYSDIPASLENIILKCTQKRPDQRYQSVTELIGDLSRVFDSPGGEFVKIKPMLDDSPTNIRSEREIALVKAVHKRISDEDYDRKGKKKKNIKKSGKEKEKTPRIPRKVPANEIYDRKKSDYERYEVKGSRLKGIFIGSMIILSVVFIIVVASYLVQVVDIFGKKESSLPESSQATTETVKEKKESGEKLDKVEMPNVLSMTKDDAEKMLKGYGLNPVFKYEKGVDKKSEELVVTKQSVEEKKKIPMDSEVTLTLGSNAAPEGMIKVPTLTKMTETEARENCNKAGFKCSVKYEKNDSVEDGSVMSQSPKAGKMLEAGSELEITVATSGQMVEMPSMVGFSEEMARQTLEEYGLRLGAVMKGHSNNVSTGEVMDFSEKIGSQIPENTRVDIKLSMGMKTEDLSQASIRIPESPFDSGEEGTLEMILQQGDLELSIYYDEHANSSQFPMDYTFDTITSGEGLLTVYVNGEEYMTQVIEGKKVGIS